MEEIVVSTILFLSFHIAVCTDGDHYGLVSAASIDTPHIDSQYCMMYNPKFKALPSTKEGAVKLKLVNMLPSVLCGPEESPPDLKQGAGAVARGNCTFSEKASLIQEYNGAAALIVSDTTLSEPMANQSSDYQEINISVALISEEDFKSILSLDVESKKIEVQFYAPDPPRIDYNLIVIWLMAVGTVTAGAVWSGQVKHKQWLRKHRRRKPDRRQEDADESDDEEPEQDTFDMNPVIVVIFVVMMCGLLLALYFLYDYLVYLIIGMFALASTFALYSVLKPLLLRIKFIGKCRIPENNLPLLMNQPEIRRIFLALLCIGIAVWWVLERNKGYAWILQDTLGIIFCVHMMKTLRLPSLKACSILLVLLFCYDIFFVFITPLLTKSGESVMVEVATGGSSSSGEMLPMVLKVPRFASSALSVCSLPYSLLGFGDILIPGLLISFCHGFDLKVQSKRVYLIANVIAYGIGLVLCFVGMALMSKGQPALLYLVPCTLLTTVIIAAKRGELGHIWKGELAKKDDDINEGRNVPNGQGAQTNGTLSVQADDKHDGSSQTSTDNEQQQLLNDSH